MTEDTLVQSKRHITDGNIEFKFYTVNGYSLPSFPAAINEGFPQRLRDIQNLETRADDVLLLSYPKSGTHWSNEIVNMLLRGKADYAKEMKIETMLEALPDLSSIDKLPTPRLLNTHLMYRWIPHKIIENGGKIIHVTRNPKDAYTSWFYDRKSRSSLESKEQNMTWTQFFDNFVAEKGKVKPYGTWFEYEREMSNAKKINKQILTVHFESLKRDSELEIRRIGQFLGVQVSDELVQDIAEKCQFNNLKLGSQKHKILPKDIMQALQESFKVDAGAKSLEIYRKGEVGDWKNHFTVAQNEVFDRMYEKEMENIGLEVIF